jgi:hypothetical protein
LAEPIPGRNVREDARRITLPGGGEIVVKSADAPNSLLGEGLDMLVLDEAAYLDEEVWARVLRPTLTDRRGRALLISTPNGYDPLFHQAWMRGHDGRPGWAAWQFPTWDSPLIDPAEIEEARETLPERVFLQEYGAQFVAMAGAVFRNVRDAATANPQARAVAGHGYVIGADWAGAGHDGDYTVFAVVDATEQALVHLDRFRGAEYAIQRARLVALWEHFDRPPVIAEANSMGEPVIEQLRRDGVSVRGFQTTNASKATLIDALALAFERDSIAILDDPVLLGELGAFVADRLPSGLTRYAARHGHDDTVMALALAWHGAGRPRSNSAVGAFAI